MSQRVRSLVMDLFGEYYRYAEGEARLGGLSTLLEAFGIDPATARVTMARLKKDGWFTTRREGRESVYCLSEAMSTVIAEGRERIFTRVDAEWDGWWTQVLYQVPESSRNDREAMRKQLTWLGFGQLATSTWMSPHEMVDRIDRLAADFPDASLDVLRTRTTRVTTDRDLTERCWDLAELAADYRDFIADYSSYESGTSLSSGPEALRVRTAMVADMRRLTFRDPELPIELSPVDWPGRPAFELFRRVHASLAEQADSYFEEVVGRRLERPVV
ncbi:PaaX family transcriptional regulator [Brevibacterium atlanticum]|uniref:PaaX family transcriptional regulator n=1 Tax=Brevibacterium atlanticum TaxID=2697563 RepID=UPI0014213179|nr:PaaX family transcriptional regulator C-terminal domain-containing protein [Brevibacterium atlanticum]